MQISTYVLKYKSVVLFAGGAALGSLVTWFATKKYYEAKANEEIENVKRAFGRRLDEIGKETEDFKEDFKEKEEIISSNEYRQVEIVRRDDPSEAEVTNYEKFYTLREELEAEDLHPMDDGEEEEALEHGDMAVKEPHPSWIPPKIIKHNDYEEMSGYASCELHYYVGDGILMDAESEDIIDNPEALIGDALVKFSFATNDEQMIYVKNENDKTIYEVYKIFAAFSDEH